MQENVLEDITKDILRDIGIVAVGNILLIMRHAKKGGFIYFLRQRTGLGHAFLLPVKRNFDSQFATIFSFWLSSSLAVTDEEQKEEKKVCGRVFV